MKKVLILPALFVSPIISSCKDKEGSPPPPPPTHTVAGLSLTKTSWTLLEKETFKLVIISPEEAAGKSIEWASGQADAATVAHGPEAVKTGTSIITAKSKTHTSLKVAECLLITGLTKEVPASAIKINPATASMIVGKNQPLLAIMTPTEASDNLEWISSDQDKATVSSAGLVMGLGREPSLSRQRVPEILLSKANAKACFYKTIYV